MQVSSKERGKKARMVYICLKSGIPRTELSLLASLNSGNISKIRREEKEKKKEKMKAK